jgi:hypothetical protein
VPLRGVGSSAEAYARIRDLDERLAKMKDKAR